MFKENKDENAAIGFYLGLLKSEEHKLENESQKAFLKGYKNYYKWVKKAINDPDEKPLYILNRGIETLENISGNIEDYKVNQKYEYIGRAIGAYISYVDNILANEGNFNEALHQLSKIDSAIDKEMITFSKRLNVVFKKIDWEINSEFIKKRVLKIAKQNPHLEPRIQTIIARMAAALDA